MISGTTALNGLTFTVIYVSLKQLNLTFYKAWANLGQGAPEVGEIEGCPSKPTHVDVGVHTREYAPTAGVKELREAVANLYNDNYRRGKRSQYT